MKCGELAFFMFELHYIRALAQLTRDACAYSRLAEKHNERVWVLIFHEDAA